MDRGQKVGGQTIVAGCDAPEVLETAEHAFDGVAVAIEIGGEAVLPDAVGFGRDVGHGALGFSQPTDLIAVVALVRVQDAARWKTFEEGQSRCAISDLPASQIEGDRSALCVSQSMDFSRSPTT